ncbi:hypothetical protein ACI45T_004745 [Vibrio vulnificus]|nr:hypothetical protein [Vibrio vulnificus]
MTTENYSIIGLKDLLNDLESLSTCLMTLNAVSEHINSSVFDQLQEDQYTLIQTINGYAAILQAIQSGNLPD